MAEVEMTLERIADIAADVGQGWTSGVSTTEWLSLLNLARKALEQEAKPVPLGEATEEHRRAVAAAFTGHYPDTRLLEQTMATREQAAHERGKAERGRGWRNAVESALGVEPDAKEHTPAWAFDRVLAAREIGNGVRNESGPIDPSEATIANAQTLADSAERERLRGLEDAVRRVGALLEANGCDCECGHHPDDHDEECTRCLACLIERTLRVQLRDAERLVRP